jgi:transmembrane sensor
MKADDINEINEKDANRVAYLIAGYIRQTLTEKEHDELDEWIVSSDDNQRLFEELTDPETIRKGLESMGQADADAALKRIKNKLSFTDKKTSGKTKRWIGYSIAASIIIVTGLVLFFMLNKKRKVEVVKKELIKPGGNYASLRFADGRTINLYDAKNGLVDSTNGKEVLKTSDGQISYESNSNGNNEFHVLSTPAGGQYSVVLADGSRVWLNSKSSLKYPVVFDGKERVVELNGEGYFEIRPLPKPLSEGEGLKTPFIVKVNGIRIEVLGTHFNVNAYTDEEGIRTSLFEGKVRVSNQQSAVSGQELRPGEQALVNKGGDFTVGNGIDMNEILGWKNGLFVFKDALIENVMRQVARWYDAEIIYEGKITHHFNGTIERKEPVEKLLHFLEGTGEVHFKIEGKRIIVNR